VTKTFEVVAAGGITNCSTNTAIATFARAEGTKELLPDITVNCTSGSGLPMNLQVYLSPALNVTSIPVGTGAASEALVGVDDGANGFLGGAVSGIVSGSTITFNNVITPAGGPFNLRITNIRVDASALPPVNDVPNAIAATIFVTGTAVNPMVLPPLNVAYAINGIGGISTANVVAAPVCSAITAAAPAFNVKFSEGFVLAFKPAGSYSVNTTLGQGRDTETGFGFAAGGGNNNASSGTRVKLVFTNVPANMAVYVPLTIEDNGGQMTLTATEAGPYAPVAPSSAPGAPASSGALVVSAGSATAIYEDTIVGGPGVIKSFVVPIYLVAGANTIPAQSPMVVTVSFAPIGAEGNAPNFISGPSTTFAFGSALTRCGSTITFTEPSDTVSVREMSR
jgi:hypothetical protein